MQCIDEIYTCLPLFFWQDNSYDFESRSGFQYDRLVKLGHTGITVSSSIPDEDKEKLITFLTTCVLPKDKELIKHELRKTAAIKHTLTKNPTSRFPKLFNLYIADIEMVTSTHW